MRKIGYISESERNYILKKYNLLVEQFDPNKEYTIKDIQDRLIALGKKYEDLLGPMKNDNKFGRRTRKSIAAAIDDIKSGALNISGSQPQEVQASTSDAQTNISVTSETPTNMTVTSETPTNMTVNSDSQTNVSTNTNTNTGTSNKGTAETPQDQNSNSNDVYDPSTMFGQK